IDIDEMKIIIRKSKTDYKSDEDGREIAITERCYWYLLNAETLIIGPKLGPKEAPKIRLFGTDKKIFPMTSDAFEQTWKRVTKYADIPTKEQDKANGVREQQCGLEFKDLRREAGSRFDEAGLTKVEHDLMLGHENDELRGTYVAPYLGSIKDKLDTYWRKAD